MPLAANRQRGVAILMALAIVAIVTLVASTLFWQQQVVIRSVENQYGLAQVRWADRALIEQARFILLADARGQTLSGQGSMSTVDHLKEYWATPLAETPLDENVAGGEAVGVSETREAVVSGAILDEQAKFNLRNLVLNPTQGINESALRQLRKLFDLVGAPEELATVVAGEILRGLPVVGSTLPVGATGPVKSSPWVHPPLLRVQDLVRLPGFDPSLVNRLIPYVTLLPEPTPVNLNTAPSVVIAALLDDLSLADAQRFVVSRDASPIRQPTELGTRLQLALSVPADAASVASSWFLVQGVIRTSRLRHVIVVLLKREGASSVRVVERKVF